MKISNLIHFILLLSLAISCGEESNKATGWQDLSSDIAPESRYESCSFYKEKENSMYIVGGLTSTTRYDDIWKYEISNNVWKPIVKPAGEELKPGGRMNYCTYDEISDALYLYGISEGGNASPSRILKWKLASHTIEEVAASNIPGTLRGHSLLLLKTGLPEPSLIIFGGEDAGGTKNNSIKIFGLNSKTFKELELTGNKPKERMFHTAAISSDNKMIIIAGKSNIGQHNDIWSFDFTTKTWTELLSDNKDISTSSSSSFYNKKDNTILMYGGAKEGSSKFSSDLTSYDISSKTLKVLESNAKPGELLGSSIIVTSLNELFIFAGNSINSKNEVVSNNKTWKNKLD